MPSELTHASRKIYYETLNVRGVGGLQQKHTQDLRSRY